MGFAIGSSSDVVRLDIHGLQRGVLCGIESSRFDGNLGARVHMRCLSLKCFGHYVGHWGDMLAC